MMKKTASVAVCLFAVVSIAAFAASDEDEQKYRFKLYGYIKLDAAWDDSRVSVGDFARWVIDETVNENDSEFNMTARQTRLGANIFAPRYGDMETSGHVGRFLRGWR